MDNEGEVVPFGEIGEIAIRSVMATHGYLHGERGMRMENDGWIYTDDAGCLSKDGYIKVMGRRSQVISRGVTLTYPGVVEKMMLRFPGVQKVRYSVVRFVCGEDLGIILSPMQCYDIQKLIL